MIDNKSEFSNFIQKVTLILGQLFFKKVHSTRHVGSIFLNFIKSFSLKNSLIMTRMYPRKTSCIYHPWLECVIWYKVAWVQLSYLSAVFLSNYLVLQNSSVLWLSLSRLKKTCLCWMCLCLNSKIGCWYLTDLQDCYNSPKPVEHVIGNCLHCWYTLTHTNLSFPPYSPFQI